MTIMGEETSPLQLKALSACRELGHFGAVDAQEFGQGGAQGNAIIPGVFGLAKAHGLLVAFAAHEDHVAGLGLQ